MTARHALCFLLSCVLILSGSGLSHAAIPDAIPSLFLTLSEEQQSSIEGLEGFYRQINEQWQVLRLDPDVDGDAIRQRLDFAQENMQRVARIRQQVTAGVETEKIDQYLSTEEQRALLQRTYFDLIHAQIQMTPTRRVELRGALLDAGMLPHSTQEMRRLMQRLKKAGFNAVYPEVFRRGYALFPNPIVAKDPELPANLDMLKLVSEAARAENLEVYPWFWMFRVLSPSIARQNPLTRRLPALMASPLDGQAYRSSNSDIEDESTAFMSPASHEWRELLTGLMNNAALKYPIQGYLLDYIRYGNNQTEDDLSLTRFQLDYFRKVGSFPSPRIAPDSDLQAQWHLWREEQVHSMVRDLRLTFGRQKNALDMGAAVFRNEIQARNTKMQHWRHWSNNGWTDFVSPMMYTNDFRELDLWMDWETDNGERNDVIYPIIGAHKLGKNSLQMLDQIHMLQQRHANGMSVFATSQLTGDMLRALEVGPFRQAAQIPHHDLQKAMLNQVQGLRQWLQDMAARGEKTGALNKDNRQLLLTFSERLKSLNASLGATTLGIAPESVTAQVQQAMEQVKEGTGLFPAALQKRILQQYGDLMKLAQNYRSQKSLQGFQKTSAPPSQVLPEARALPSMQIPFVSSAPVIDARLDESVWQEAYRLPQLFWNTGSARATTPTEIRVAHDHDNLYIAYVNDEPRNDRVKVSYRQDSSFLNTDDTVQIFLDPEGKNKNYYYFVVNPANVRYQRASFDNYWNGRWQSAARQFSHGWIVEMAIPFRSLGVGPDQKNWKGNFCRRRPQEITDFHCWSFTYGGVHRLDRLGNLNFVAAK